MFTAATIARIIELTLEIALEAIKGMTPEQKVAFWERHEARMAFWQKLMDRVTPGE